MVRKPRTTIPRAIVAHETAPTDQQLADKKEVAALLRKQHARRLLGSINSGYMLTGLRLSDPKSEHADGVVVTFDEAEGKAIAQHVKKLIEARK